MDGFLEGLQDGVVEASPDTWRTLRDQTARMRRLVEDVGTVSRAEERRLELSAEPVDLGALAAGAVRAAGQRYQDKGVVLDLAQVHEPVFVTGDPDRLHEVIDNLLANALRHTPASGRGQGHVEVSVRASGDSVLVEVVDDVEGIEASSLVHVFDRFYRADSARLHDTGGSGIGLTVARALVHAHGGVIAVRIERSGRGARFTVVLPRAGQPSH